MSPIQRWTAASLSSILATALSAAVLPGIVWSEESDSGDQPAAVDRDVTQGALRIEQQDGSLVECPLTHTDVTADISGFIARVNVTQTFQNPTEEKIEAVYVFPLPHEAAVDSMTMRIGERKIVGLIKRRDAARRIYEQALAAGQTAALLEQERPNVFTQSVGNIEPGQEVHIEISYVDVLKYDIGTYEFQFPMVVGPRFIPGGPVSSPQPTPPELQGKVSPPVANTDRVPDARRISPPVLKPGFRNGHDISLAVTLDAGVPIQDLQIANHEADVEIEGDRRAQIRLSPADSMPNKDFVVRYDVTGQRPELAVLSHTGQYTDTGRLGEGYFMLMIQPQEDEKLKQMPPREIVFLVDVSGSMRGDLTAKVRDAMQSMLGLCRESDTVQVVTFAGQANKLFERPVPVTAANIETAVNFTKGLRGSGGTHMLQGVKMAIDQPIDQERLRIVVMLTDGYIGNEAEIIQHVGKNCGDQIRFWAIGIGSSPNMFLVDGVARQGGGMGKLLGLNDDTVELTQEIMHRIQRAQLAKIEIDWGGLEVAETFPAKIPELWAGRPVILFGRYRDGGGGDVTVSGLVEGEPVNWPLTIQLPKAQPENDVLAKVWARRKIEDLMHQTYYQGSPAVEEEVTAIALDYKLMSQYTSFVAVDESKVGELAEPARPPRRMLVPVPLPAGTVYEGFFGDLDLDGEGENALEVAGRSLDLAFRGDGQTAAAKESKLFAAPGLGARFARDRGVVHSGLAPARLPASIARAPRPADGRFKYRGQSLLGDIYGQPRNRRSSMRRAGFGSAGVGQIGGGKVKFMQETNGRAGNAVVTRFNALVDDVSADPGELNGADLESQLFHHALITDGKSGALAEAASEAQKAATAKEDDGDLAAAQAAYRRAYLLDSAAANFAASQLETASRALEGIERLHARQVADWTMDLPALNQKLDLVLRDRSIEDALAEISQAAGVAIELVPGALDDAADLLHQTPHVSYLDLRRATLASALEWTLRPAGMRWSVEGDKIVATTDRRVVGESAWVYDLSVVALPMKEELGDLSDHETALESARQAAHDFVAAVRSDLAADESSVVWFASGQLLVIGDAQTHQKATGIFAGLTDGEGDQPLEGAIAKLYPLTQKRLEARSDGVARRAAISRKLNVAAAHSVFGWRLLAAAAGGQLDLEALTELQIAWLSPKTAELLDGPGAGIALKSLWIVSEAAQALPHQEELQALVETARAQSQQAADSALTALQEDPEDAEAFTRTFYAALALRDDPFLDAAIPLLTEHPDQSQESTLRSARALAQGLLADRGQIDRVALAKIIESGAAGDDMVVLVAMSARRAGGDIWQTYRREARDRLSKQPLSGSVVVLVNRLSGAPFSLLAAR